MKGGADVAMGDEDEDIFKLAGKKMEHDEF